MEEKSELATVHFDLRRYNFINYDSSSDANHDFITGLCLSKERALCQQEPHRIFGTASPGHPKRLADPFGA
jgi:hypothetical protein